MPEEDPFRRYLEAGMALFQVTQQKAEAALRNLGGSAESARETARGTAKDLLGTIGDEVRAQVQALGLATRDDLAGLEKRLAARIEGMAQAEAAPKKRPAKTTRPAKAARPPRP